MVRHLLNMFLYRISVLYWVARTIQLQILNRMLQVCIDCFIYRFFFLFALCFHINAGLSLRTAVSLLQIVMVSPGTHVVKNHGSQSRTTKSQLKKTSLKLKMLGPLCTCNQTVNLKTDSKTLYHSILKSKYSPSILKYNKRLICIVR